MSRARAIDEDVLAVLSACTTSGSAVMLPTGDRLDRKLYERVNKVLEALGGKWNRKAKGHVFAEDPAGKLDDAIVSGEYDKPADFGFFETSPELCARLVDAAGIVRGDVVLEPSAGTGNIVAEIVKREPARVWVVELQEQNREKLYQRFGTGGVVRHLVASEPEGAPTSKHDFMQIPLTSRFDRVAMNPPFAKGQDVAHVTRAYEMLNAAGKLAAIMSAGVEFREDKRTQAFRALVDEARGTIERLPEGSFKGAGTMVHTVLVTMNKR